MIVSDASTEDWATIGVKVLSIALVPEGGGGNVTVYTAPATVPTINLVMLDQLGELIGNASVPVGTYTSAVLTISGNPGDVSLAVASDPEAGFTGTPGALIPSAQIQIQHTQGTAPNLTVPVSVKFVSPLVVSATANNQLDLEFDLGHPAFIVQHVPAATGTTIWAVNFDGPVHHHPRPDIDRLTAVLAKVREGVRLRQLVDHHHQGVPDRAGGQPGDGNREHAVFADPGRFDQWHDLL